MHLEDGVLYSYTHTHVHFFNMNLKDLNWVLVLRKQCVQNDNDDNIYRIQRN